MLRNSFSLNALYNIPINSGRIIDKFLTSNDIINKNSMKNRPIKELK